VSALLVHPLPAGSVSRSFLIDKLKKLISYLSEGKIGDAPRIELRIKENRTVIVVQSGKLPLVQLQKRSPDYLGEMSIGQSWIVAGFSSQLQNLLPCPVDNLISARIVSVPKYLAAQLDISFDLGLLLHRFRWVAEEISAAALIGLLDVSLNEPDYRPFR
jgi:hypothetical protein